MDQRLKERLIGAAVLVALAVWLIPWLLDGPAEERRRDTASLTLPAAEEAAPLKTVTIDLDDRGRPEVPADNAAPAGDAADPPEDAAAARSSSEPAPRVEVAAVPPSPEATEPVAEPRSAAPAETEETTEPAGPAEDGVAARAPESAPAGGWAVQLGSFGESGNAERLAARVATFGYEPEVSTYEAGGRDLHRVRVGPQPSRARAEAVASALTAHGFVAQVVTTD